MNLSNSHRENIFENYFLKEKGRFVQHLIKELIVLLSLNIHYWF